MLNALIHAHSGFRWILLLLMVITTFLALFKWRSNAPFLESDRKTVFFTMLAAHIQLLLGIVLFFLSPKVHLAAESMKIIPLTRFFTLEHSVMMLVSIVLVTVGYSKTKQASDDNRKFKTVFLFFFLALILLLAGIPWPFRGFGSGWY